MIMEMWVEECSTGSSSQNVQMRTFSGRSKMQQQQQQRQSSERCTPLSPLGIQRIQSTISTRSVKALDVCIFLKDGTGHELFLDNALVDSAEDIFSRMLGPDHLGLPQPADEVFFLWITSPLLHLQLKNHHVPFKLCRKWHDLLDKFTSATEEQKANDEPVLCFQRNAFFPKSKEKDITDPKIIRLLFAEAKYNILEGNYPCEAEDFEYLAGILAYIEHGRYNPEDHPTGFLKLAQTDRASSSNQPNQTPYLDPLQQYVPACMCKGGSRWIKRKGFATLEQRVMNHWDQISLKVSSKKECYQLFLTFCRQLPFYGCVFFSGQVKKQSSIIGVRDSRDRPVYVGINKEGVYVIDVAKQDVILGLTYDELSWEFTDVKEDRPDCSPSLWLEFDSLEGSRKCSKVLQITSKQAVMMNAIIEANVDELNKQDYKGKPQSKTLKGGLLSETFYDSRHCEVDLVDGGATCISFQRVAMEASAPAVGILPVKEPKTAISNKCDRLCLVTFSETGDLISRKNSWKSFSLFRSSDSR